ncbi:hypothetical protein BKA62DRAFT_759001 [Auriculariales sp. MPI-PUGE-AT-0066]|nr:hypothetical protein BKA62DRAFT_759001 [Auriculariales sp. MPI-PUGE-AT-0066]
MSRIFEVASRGPRVNERDTLVRAISRENLPAARSWSTFLRWLRIPVMPPGLKRFPGGPPQLVEEISPGSWTFVCAYAEDAQDVIATVTIAPGISKPGTEEQQEAVVRHMKAAGTTRSVFGMDEGPIEGEERWTIRLLCVRVDLQRRGIADWFMKFAENAIVELVQETNAAQKKPVTKFVRFMLSTIEEHNGAYYSKRGWLVSERHKMPPGYSGSEGGFTFVDMYKLMLLHSAEPEIFKPTLRL